MTRLFAVAIALAYFTSCASAQTPTTQAPATAQKALPASKPATKKPAAAKTGAKLAAPASNGPCQIGVISTVGHEFTLQKIGLTVLGNELVQVPIDSWGLDDLAVARVRAAVPGATVRKISYASGAFDSYFAPKLFRDAKAELATIVRQIAANAGCGRYVVLLPWGGQYPGTNQTVSGIGVVNRNLAGLMSHNLLFAYIDVKVFDGQSFEILKNPNDTFASRLAAGWTDADPKPPTEPPYPASAADTVNNTELREATRALVTRRLDKALTSFFKE
jgi:hypothetical protein